MPSVEKQRIMNIASLTIRGLISRDPQIEKRLRQELSLPTDYIDKEIKAWEENGTFPSKTETDVKVKEVLEELVEEIIEERKQNV